MRTRQMISSSPSGRGGARITTCSNPASAAPSCSNSVGPACAASGDAKIVRFLQAAGEPVGVTPWRNATLPSGRPTASWEGCRSSIALVVDRPRNRLWSLSRHEAVPSRAKAFGRNRAGHRILRFSRYRHRRCRTCGSRPPSSTRSEKRHPQEGKVAILRTLGQKQMDPPPSLESPARRRRERAAGVERTPEAPCGDGGPGTAHYRPRARRARDSPSIPSTGSNSSDRKRRLSSAQFRRLG